MENWIRRLAVSSIVVWLGVDVSTLTWTKYERSAHDNCHWLTFLARGFKLPQFHGINGESGARRPGGSDDTKVTRFAVQSDGEFNHNSARPSLAL